MKTKVTLLSLYFLAFVHLMHAEKLTLTLESAEKIAIANNLTILQKKQLYKNAISKRFYSVGYLFPKIEVGAIQNFKNYETRSSRYSSITFSQMIFDGAIYKAISLATIDEKLNFLNLETQRRNVLLKTKKIFFLNVLRQNQEKLAKEQMRILQESLDEEVKKFSIGNSTTYDVNICKVQLFKALGNLYKVHMDFQKAQKELAAILGMSQDVDIFVEGSDIDIEIFPWLKKKIEHLRSGKYFENEFFEETFREVNAFCIFSQEEIENLKQIMKSFNANVMKKKLQKLFAEKNYEKVVAKNLPTMVAQAKKSSTPHSSSIFKSPKHWNVSVELSLNIFNGMQSVNEKKGAKREQNVAKLEYEQSIEDETKLLEEIIMDIETNVIFYIAAKNNVLLSEYLLQQAREKRILGAITALDYQKIAKDFNDERQNLQNVTYEIISKCYDLEFCINDKVFFVDLCDMY